VRYLCRRCGILPSLTVSFLLSACCLPGQLVQIGPSDPQVCENVKVHPNLVLDVAVDLGGHVEDPSGAALVHKRIEVRKYISEVKQSSFRQVQTDGNGDFSVGVLPAGKYRLLIFARGFKQPRDLQCKSGKICKLNVVPAVAPTDTFPESVCSPK
jgi:hypothetical protein